MRKYIRDAKISYIQLEPLLAQPGPANDAIHWALLSLLISSSILIVTALLAAASLAAGVGILELFRKFI